MTLNPSYFASSNSKPSTDTVKSINGGDMTLNPSYFASSSSKPSSEEYQWRGHDPKPLIPSALSSSKPVDRFSPWWQGGG